MYKKEIKKDYAMNKKIVVSILLFYSFFQQSLFGYMGGIRIINREPYPILIQEIQWKGCGDDKNIKIPAYGVYNDTWSLGTCRLEKIRLIVEDQYRYTYQNKYDGSYTGLTNQVPRNGLIECVINRRTSLPGGQKEPIMCWRVKRNGTFIGGGEIQPSGHFEK